jgi:hypothetical protein
MSKVYVQATSIIYETNEHGEQVTYHPPSWVPVSKARARELIANGQVRIPRSDRYREAMQFDDCGIVIRSGEASLPELGRVGELVSVEYDDIRLPFQYTMLWRAEKIALREQAIIAGFSKLLDFEGTGKEKWEILAMLADENKIAADYGSKWERDKTLETIGDLRLPVYETGILWVRKTENSERVIAAWVEELEQGADERHAFLRALYTHRAMTYTLAPDWHLRHL